MFAAANPRRFSGCKSLYSTPNNALGWSSTALLRPVGWRQPLSVRVESSSNQFGEEPPKPLYLGGKGLVIWRRLVSSVLPVALGSPTTPAAPSIRLRHDRSS